MPTHLNPFRSLALLAPSECRSAASPCCSIRSKLCTSQPTKRKSKGRIRETWTEDHRSVPAAQPYWTEMVREVVTALDSVSSSCISHVFILHMCSIALENCKIFLLICESGLRMNAVQDRTPSPKDSFKLERVGQWIALLALFACGRRDIDQSLLAWVRLTWLTAFHTFRQSAGCGISPRWFPPGYCGCVWWLLVARALPFKPLSMLTGIEFLC